MAPAIVVTGASRGLGRALALEYAAPGVALALIGRDAGRLDSVAEAARAKGARVRTGRIDVRDAEAMRAFLVAADEADPTTLAIAAAGVTMVTPEPAAVEDLTRSRDLFDVNWNGAMNTLAPLAPRMRARRQGQIALFGSIAAFAPPPDSPSYAASKAALVAFALATRALYEADAVSVSVVCPGFVDTDMTRSFDSAKPFLIGPDDAARRIRRGLDRRRAVIAFPRRLYWAARLQQLLPEPISRRIMLRLRAVANSEGAG
jgi:short-subunit dehydrogenase